MKQFWNSWWKLKLEKKFWWKIHSINIKILTRKNLLKVANILLVFEQSQTVDSNFFNIFWWNFFKINTFGKIFGESFCKIKNCLSFHQKFFLTYINFYKILSKCKNCLNAWNFETKLWKINNLTAWENFLVKNLLLLPSEIVFTKKFF